MSSGWSVGSKLKRLVMDDREGEPLLGSKDELSSSNSTGVGVTGCPRSRMFGKVTVLITVVSGLLFMLACCNHMHMDMNDSMDMTDPSMKGNHDVNEENTIGVGIIDNGTKGRSKNNMKDVDCSSSVSVGGLESIENMFTSLFHDIEQPGDIKGFAPDIMKLLENNITNDIDYGYGTYFSSISLPKTLKTLKSHLSLHCLIFQQENIISWPEMLRISHNL